MRTGGHIPTGVVLPAGLEQIGIARYMRSSAVMDAKRTGGARGRNPRQPEAPGCWHSADSVSEACEQGRLWRGGLSFGKRNLLGTVFGMTSSAGGVEPLGSGWAGERGRRPRGSSAAEEEATRGLSQRLAVVKAVCCYSNHTRPVSWRGSAFTGAHPRTKGARCFAGGHRYRILSTRRVSWRFADRR